MSRKTGLGVDIGGTFTDVVLEHEGVFHSVKTLTTPDAPEKAIIEGIELVCGKAHIMPASIERVIHGTTLATNALIERRGAKTAFITTHGFRDVIEMRTESRFEQYDLNLQLPDPLIFRQDRFVVHERIDARGDILVALANRQVESLAETLNERGYESVAIGLLHSYLNESHERMIGDILHARLPDLDISLSCEVSPQMREYERFNTVCANAYVKPLMKRYLLKLNGCLKEIGVSCPVFLMHSGGGIISLENACAFPVRLVESGPAGGAIFACDIARRYDLEKVLSFDMGGTTAKICLINKHIPKTSRVFEVARSYRFKKGSGMPISIPVIDMVEIGAGGGSLAYIDSLNRICVGPQSAGADPGPACYDRGGTHPAVTDADLILGKLSPDYFAAGTMSLSISAAQNALDRHIGRKLNLDTVMSAFGINEVVDENMSNAARVHAVESGEDLCEYTMIAFGGAAALHAGRLCEKLGIDCFLVPVGAGVGSAIGFLRSAYNFESTRSIYMRFSDFDGEKIKKIFAELENEATTFVRSCDATLPLHSEYKAYIRYIGQGWEIPVILSPADVASPKRDIFLHRFEENYKALFVRTVEGLEVEITGWAVHVTTPIPASEKLPPTRCMDHVDVKERRSLFAGMTASFSDVGVVPRELFTEGKFLDGPAIITEDETTIIVPARFRALMCRDGCLKIYRYDLEQGVT